MFLQPIISSGDYSEFKELAAPKTDKFNVYGKGIPKLTTIIMMMNIL
jgi:hypothetical protein